MLGDTGFNMSMQRFLVITELFLPTKGGTAVWFDEVYRRIGDRTTHVVTAAVPDWEAHDRNHPNTVHRLNLKRNAWLRPESLAMYIKFFFCALWLAGSRRFSAIHAGRALPEGLVAWIVARLTFHPIVIYAHGEELTAWGYGVKYRVMKHVLRRADVVIANSEYTKEVLMKMGVSRSSINMINPGVDVDRFRPGLPHSDLRAVLGIGDSSRLLISVGRLSRRKGFDSVIRVLPRLIEEGIDLHYAIIGIGEDENYLESLARDLAIERRVHLIGPVSWEDLPRWYNACDIFLMPNRDINGDTEGFGMVFLEAAACGRPTIAGIAGGTGSAVLHGKTGLRVNGDSMQEVQQSIRLLLSDRELATELGTAGQDRARTQFSWSFVAERVKMAHQRAQTNSESIGEY